MIKTIFFDLDDTLYLFEDSPSKLKAEVDTVKEINKRLNKELYIVFDDFISSRHKFKDAHKNDAAKYDRFAWYQTFLKEMGIADDEFAKELEKLYWNVLAENIVPYEDLKTIIPQLYQKYNLYVLTDGLEYGQMVRMKAMGFDKYFDGILCSEQHNSLKPDKKVFDYGLKIAGCNPSEAIMIGDKPHKDIKGANNAGIISIWIRRGKYAGTNPDGDNKPRYIIKNYFKLIKILDELK